MKRSTLVWLEVSVLVSGPIGAFRVAERLDTSAVFLKKTVYRRFVLRFRLHFEENIYILATMFVVLTIC